MLLMKLLRAEEAIAASINTYDEDGRLLDVAELRELAWKVDGVLKLAADIYDALNKH